MEVDLRGLAELTLPERTFLSVYLAGPRSAAALAKRLERTRRALRGRSEGNGRAQRAERDEREHFDENAHLVSRYLEKNPLRAGSLALFACWALDFFRAVPMAAPLEDLIWVDSSPYIGPLAEFEDEYENVAVVVADNRKARVYIVSAAVAGDEETVKGNVKNHVKKGGWSQQRYWMQWYHARLFRVIRARITQIMNLLCLAPDIELQVATTPEGLRRVVSGVPGPKRVVLENGPLPPSHRGHGA